MASLSPALAAAFLLVLLLPKPALAEAPVCMEGFGKGPGAHASEDSSCRQPNGDTQGIDCEVHLDGNSTLDSRLAASCTSPSPGMGLQDSNDTLQACLIIDRAQLCADANECLLPPTGLTATDRQGGVFLDWEAPPTGEPLGYAIYRAIAIGEGVAEVTTTSIATVSAEQTWFFDTTVQPKVSYVYWVTALGPGCQSAPSTMATSGFPPNLFHCISPALGYMPPFYIAPDCRPDLVIKGP
jgi:hypothetical protein